jgi:hypothetical protein
MKKKIKFEDLTLEMKKDIFVKLIGNTESPKDTQKRYNITEKTMNKICQEFIFDKIHETEDGIMEITGKSIMDVTEIAKHENN